MRDQFITSIEADPGNEMNRLVFADWLEENGEIDFAKALREASTDEDGDRRPVPPLRRVVEVDIPTLVDDGDWAEVFADYNSGNVSKDTDRCPPGSDVDTTPPSRADVVEVIAAANGCNDEEEWIGVFLLRDGRYLLASGSCDYTGWD